MILLMNYDLAYSLAEIRALPALKKNFQHHSVYDRHRHEALHGKEVTTVMELMPFLKKLKEYCNSRTPLLWTPPNSLLLGLPFSAMMSWGESRH